MSNTCTLVQGSGRGAAGLPFVVWALGQILLLLLYGLALTIRWERVSSVPLWVRRLLLDFSSYQHQRRSSEVFFLDCVTKQFGGFALLSLLDKLSMPWLQERASADDGCDVLWWSVALQAVVGTMLVRLLKEVATTYVLTPWRDLAALGEYKGCGTVVQRVIAAKQLAVWLVLVLLMKLAVIGLQGVMGSRLLSLRRFLGDRPQMELFVVVFLAPAVLNTYMFLAFDTMNSCSQLPWQLRRLEFEGVHSKPELRAGVDSEQFMIHCCENADFAHYYGFSSFSEEDRPSAAMQFHEAHRDVLEDALEVQRRLVSVFNERLDLGGGGSVQQWEFVDICRTNHELLKFVNGLDTEPGIRGMARVYGNIRNDGECTMAQWRQRYSTEPLQPVVSRALSRTSPAAQLRQWISPQRLLAWVAFFQDVFSPEEDPRRQGVKFWHLHCFFHGKPPQYPAELRSRLECFVREENGGIQEPDAEPEGLPDNLRKWGGEDHGSEFTVQEVDPSVASFVNSQDGVCGAFLVPGTRRFETDLSMWDHNEEVVRMAVNGAVKPSLNHCLGPAVQVARLGVVWNTMAWFLMPWVAQSTMDCSPLERGFADHILPSWGVLFDICCLGVFIAVSWRLQREIMRYLILGQVCRQPTFKLELPLMTIDFSRYSYSRFLWLMQILTALNLMNTWTNAEVFGRVLTTVNWCSDKGGTEVTHTWMKVVRSSGTLGWVDPHSNFLVVTSLVYCLIFFQAIFAVVFSSPLDSQVNYNVGQPYEGHHGYKTLWEPTAGTSHKAVVQTLAALVPYEAVIFQDATCGLLEMQERLERAKRFREPLVEDANIPRPRGSLVAHEIIGYLRELQAQLQRSLAKLMLVGFLQNAFQTKLQITFLSLDFNRKGECDAVFCLGIVFNLLGYLMSAAETWDLVKLGSLYYSQRKEIEWLLSDRDIRFEQSRELIMRFVRIRGGFVMGLLFSVIYLVYLIYLLINFGMIFVCESHIWNLSLDLREGCFDPDAVNAANG